ncbi:MAG: cytochrome c [Bacteroidetes bacterium]|nr:cytochrome c [Bacteroidota bacterium]
MREIPVTLLLLCFSFSPYCQGNTTPNSIEGAKLYHQYCMSCHQADGGGVPQMTPPLVSTNYVTGDKKRLITILLNGLNEPIVINDEVYYNPMASFGYLTDRQIAAVLTYIRKSFGNQSTSVSTQEVSKIRKQLANKN